jgi:uncharacterized protein (TIGR02284 family)
MPQAVPREVLLACEPSTYENHSSVLGGGRDRDASGRLLHFGIGGSGRASARCVHRREYGRPWCQCARAGVLTRFAISWLQFFAAPISANADWCRFIFACGTVYARRNGMPRFKSMTTTKTISAVLNRLIETCRDGEHGFRTAADDVQNPSLRVLFDELSSERTRFISELQDLVRSVGEDPDTTGSIAGAMHRAWINIKSAVSSGDEGSILEECERGEDSAVNEYRQALEQELPPSIRNVVQRQYFAIQQAHDRVRALRDGANAEK